MRTFRPPPAACLVRYCGFDRALARSTVHSPHKMPLSPTFREHCTPHFFNKTHSVTQNNRKLCLTMYERFLPNPYPGLSYLDTKGHELPELEPGALYAFSIKRTDGPPPTWSKVLFFALSKSSGTMYTFCPATPPKQGCNYLIERDIAFMRVPRAYGKIRLLPPHVVEWEVVFDAVNQMNADQCRTDVDCIVAVLKSLGVPLKHPETFDQEFRTSEISWDPERMGDIRSAYVTRPTYFEL
ncbi:hypothetical protein CALVIDRAFT_396940 [Calocera viscosa TUFC12733]|uniref:Uncharacterized protein n=1 Tax=Calocera viscosa (strain TUFC12733) TaxID=1330018 RepID=A0A167PPS0_CALVF|nr:hypothetical protein CALVIDRAFT_396940 [Calocera viscosa TUFC12733]